MSSKKKSAPRNKKDSEESQEIELFVIDEESLVNLTEHVSGLSAMVESLVSDVSDMKTDNDVLRDQVEHLEKIIRIARYNA